VNTSNPHRAMKLTLLPSAGEAVDKLCAEHGMTLSFLINTIVLNLVEANDEQLTKTLLQRKYRPQHKKG
jgi:hypothetical protein